MDIYACKILADNATLDDVSEAYIGRVYHVTIPKVKTDKFEPDIATILKLSEFDKIVGFSIYETIKGQKIKAVDVSIRGCSSNLITPGGYGVLYKHNGLWVFSPDEALFSY